MVRTAARTELKPESGSPPRAGAIWAAVICFFATALLAWPAFLGKFLVNPSSDQYIAGYPFREFAAQSLRAGNGFPTWNPFQFGGMPYVAAMHGDIFYPTFLLRLVLPTDVAMTWGFIVHVVLAGFFTYGFLRASGVRFHASLIGGVAYLLSGAVASYPSPGHDGKLFVSALLPAALWALVRGMRDGRMSAWGLLAIVVGLAVLSPHPQLLQYMLLTSGAFAVFLAFRPDSIRRGGNDALLSTTPKSGSQDTSAVSNPVRRIRFTRLAFAMGSVVLGMIIGAVQYLPVMQYVDWSPRSGGKGYDYATSFSLPLEETINTYLPQFSGILENYWGRNGIHFHSEYMGAAVLVLALFAFGGGVLNRHRTHAWFWLATLVVSMFWALGGETPFYHLIYEIVPGSKFFRAPSTILYVATFSVATLAAFGAERAMTGQATARYAISWVAFALVVAILATLGVFTNMGMSIAGSSRADAILANASNVVVGAWRSMLFVLAAVAVITLIARGKLEARRGAWVLLAVVVVDLWSVERNYWRFSEPAKVLYAEDAIIRYIKSQPEPARVIALPLSDNMAPHDPFLAGDALMHHGIRGVLGYHGNELGRYQELYGKNEGYQAVANPNFWSLTNSRFFYTNAAEVPFPGATLVAGPVRDAAGTMTYLFELPGKHPAAWVTPLIVKLDDETAKATLLNPLFDVNRVAIFDTAAPVASKPVDSALPPPVDVQVTVTRYEPGAIDISLQGNTPEGSALVVSENFYPGWSAKVDGLPVEIGRADFTLIGIPLSPSAKNVQLRFESAPVRTGGFITLVALLVAVILAIVGVLFDRRSSKLASAEL